MDQSLLLNTANEYGSLADRKFCNFVYSNNVNSDPIRDAFFFELSKYRKVDSGGRHLNNIGGPVKDKLGFIKNYKFTIAFENSAVPGYTTEKLLEPILVKSIPVYFGNPLVYLDFEPGSFIMVDSRADFDRAIDAISMLDKDDQKYMEMLERNKFQTDNNLDAWENKLKSFLANIFDQPWPSAFRKPKYGFNSFYAGEFLLQSQLLSNKQRHNSLKARIKRFLPGLGIH
jgi:hypothetical protein